MKWIRTGRQIGQAVKNVQRLRQILFVFGKHGFEDVIDRMNLGKFIPTRWTHLTGSEPDASIPERLRLCFEELGPAFVKLGQLLSTRSDLLPDSFIEEFTKLQDHVQPVSFDAIQNVVEKDLKKPLLDAFEYFNPEPLASASIAQVHEARLHSGEKVVVKVQRPEIKKIIQQDISLLAFLAKLLEKYIPETRTFNPSVIVDEFFRTLNFELNFLVEANNMEKIRENMAPISEIVIPKVYRSFTTERILVQEKIEGIRVNDLPALDAAGIDKKAVVRTGAYAFFKSIMIDGLFHGDLHGGNLFVLPGNKLAIIDFGIVGRLSRKARDQLANMVIALLTEDYETLCYQYAELGAADPSIDFDSFQRDVRNALSPYMGLNLSELNSGRVLIESTKIATKYKIKVPGDWMLVFRAIVTTEGMARSLDPEFDMLSMGQTLAKELLSHQYSAKRIAHDTFWIAKEVGALLQVLPRQIRWMFRKFNRNDFAIEIKSADLQGISHQMERTGRKMSLAILAGALFVASSLALNATDPATLFGHPAISVIYAIVGLLLLLRLIWI